MRYFSHLNTANQLIISYSGNEPFAAYAKKYFSLHKKYGSKDRKNILHLCYCYFRLGKDLPAFNTEERMIAGLFLCSSSSNNLLQQLKPDWNKKASESLAEKCKLVNLQMDALQQIFYWQDELAKAINGSAFSLSHLQQPDLFLRIRPGKENAVISKLNNASIAFKQKAATTIALANGSKIEELIVLNKEAVVQDYSSQQVGNLMQTAIQQLQNSNLKSQISVWDCCAASGGKSILLFDINPNIQLTVSDIRESILANLKKRFTEAGIKQYKSFVADLSNPKYQNQNNKFQLIIADVPCSGSGTWGRTPEQLVFFKEEKIAEYAALQKKIVSAALKSLADKGYFLYITCSVFKQENEAICDYLQQHSLEMIEQKTVIGYNDKADTMFAALFKKV